MQELEMISIQLKRLDNTLDLLANDRQTKCITETYYRDRKAKVIEKHRVALESLNSFLENNGALEVSKVLQEIMRNATDESISAGLGRLRAESENEPWGPAVRNALDKHEGSVVKIGIKVAQEVARDLVEA